METKPDNSHLKGQALIALAAAAGVVAASRLSRTGLALSAGLAWHFWNSRKARPDPVQAKPPEEAVATVAPPAPAGLQGESIQPPDQPPEAEPTMGPAVALPVTPPLEDTRSPAWDDLRAALAPSLEMLSEETSPGQVEPEAGESREADGPAGSVSPLTPPLPEIQPFPPTDPWIETTEPMPPSAAEVPAMPEPEPPDFLIDPEEPPPTPAAQTASFPMIPGTTLLPKHVLPPSIITRESGGHPTPVPMTTPPGLVMPSSQEDSGGGVGQPESEEKKNFFNWLRS